MSYGPWILYIYIYSNIILASRVGPIIFEEMYLHSTKGNTNPVCVLVQHFILFTIECRMVFKTAVFIVCKCL